jgi:hypothetical protein
MCRANVLSTESGKLDAAAWIGNPAPAFLLTAPDGATIHLNGREEPL